MCLNARVSGLPQSNRPQKWKYRKFSEFGRVKRKQLTQTSFKWPQNDDGYKQKKTTATTAAAATTAADAVYSACIFNRIQTICPRDFLPKRLLYNNDLCVLFYQSTTQKIFDTSLAALCKFCPTVRITTSTKCSTFFAVCTRQLANDTNCGRWRHV